MASVEIALVCGLKVRVGCQDRLRVNSEAYFVAEKAVKFSQDD